jgi:hypothetical protein
MAQLAYRDENTVLLRKTDWGAIWAGVFTFVAIWTVFGSLGMAIFASSANPTTARPVLGMSVGIGIWAIILTIIAMYVAGRETAHMATVNNRHDALLHGMIMFGLSVIAAIVVTTIGGSALNSGAQNVNSTPYVFTVVADLGWIGFASLFLGWLAAMWGAASGVMVTRTTAEVRDIKSVA